MTSLLWWLLDLAEAIWLDSARLSRIQRQLAQGVEGTPPRLVPDHCAIYKLARRADSLVVDLPGDLEAGFGAFTRLYLVDGAPDALEGKPQRLIAFGPLRTTPFAHVDSEGPFLRNGRRVLHPAPGPRRARALQGPALGLAALPAAVPVMASMPPLGGGFVPTDLPVPPAGAPRPPAPAGGPPSTCGPV